METELNFGLTFDQAAAATSDPRRIRGGFVGGTAETTERLLAGTKLYKWTHHPLVGPRGITPWWCFLEDRKLNNGKTAEGLTKRQAYADRLTVPDGRYHRTSMAVTEQWNRMTKPLVIQLLKTVWGFAGKASGQLQDEDVSDVYLIGGGYQIYIPSLTIAYVRQVAALPYLTLNRATS